MHPQGCLMPVKWGSESAPENPYILQHGAVDSTDSQLPYFHSQTGAANSLWE